MPIRHPSPSKVAGQLAKPSFGPSVPSTTPAGPPKPSRTFQATPAADSREEHPTDTLQSKSILQKRSMFEGPQTPAVESPDPSCIPLSQRKALFEKIKSVPTPIARFGDAVTPAMLAKKPTTSTVETPSEAWKRKRAVSPTRPPSPSRRPASPVRRPMSPVRRPVSPTASKMETSKEVEGGAGIGEARRLFSAATPATPDWRENEIAKKAAQEKQAEMDILMNRYKHLRQPVAEQKSSPEKAKSSSKKVEEEEDPKYYPGVNSMKRVRVSPPKEGQLYPQIDFDSDRPESVMSSDTLNDSYESQMTNASEAPSLGKHIMAAASRQQTAEQQELSTIAELHSDSMDTDEGDGLTDSVLEAALDDEEEEDQPTPPKVAKTSSSSSGSEREGAVGRSESTSSWEYHTPTSQPRSQQKFKTPMIVTSPGPASPKVAVEGEDGPLLHTVSFYRSQKPPNTPVARVTIEPRIPQNLESTESPRATISQRILRLQEEAAKQMPVIQQASQALNLCRSTKEFFGSSEQVRFQLSSSIFNILKNKFAGGG